MARKKVSKKPAAAAARPRAAKALTVDSLEDRAYRIHFRGGTSGEYNGHQLRHCAPFDLNEVTSIDPV
jgi:hypothetical protein